MPFIDHFDLLAPIYDRCISSPDPERLQRLLGLPREAPLLDVGGGTGRVAEILQELGQEVIILDASLPMLEQAHAKGLTAVNAYAEQLPFATGTFERILIVDAIHHVANVPQVLAEFCRVLRPGTGRLVIQEPDIRHFSVKVIAFLERLTLMRSRFYDAQHLVRLLGDCNVRTSVTRAQNMYWISVNKQS
jgi:demethylmenaquinone methyltransferase/2-methoxy-6-polyprenyl-1,4-benzoquinol methylase